MTKRQKPVWVEITVKVPPSLHRRLTAAAKEFGIPLEQYVAGALVDLVSPEGAIIAEPGDFA
jgi:predicted HicB family RNase H-like nuclease